MKVAIIHYWLTKMRGGEKVLENICDIYPEADIYTHVYNPNKISERLKKHNIYTTFINSLPYSKKKYRYYLPLMPFALKKINLSSYDLIVSSEAGPSKGVNINREAKHVCYCHSPMRYIWDMSSIYYKNFNILEKIGYKLFIDYLKRWDVNSASNIDLIIANSDFVQKRIQKYWKKSSVVVNPSINLSLFANTSEDNGYYIVVSELVSYKRIDLVIEVFNKNNKKVIIIGDGPLFEDYKSISKPNIKYTGYLDDDKKIEVLSKSKALIFPGIEDFGIVPLEAMACGKPIVAFNGGGAVEYMKDGINAKLFNHQTPKSLSNAIEEFELEYHSYDANTIVDTIKEYSNDNFKSKFKNHVDEILSNI